MRTYSEMIRLASFEERLRYLLIGGSVGRDTFGYDRYLNQMFYKNPEWKKIRREVILRDSGNSKDCFDLACEDRPIAGFIYVHHIEPITRDDVLAHSDLLLDPDNLVCCSKATHDLIHYGSEERAREPLFAVRQPGDTKLW